jgi:hypothetical protein
MMQHNEKNKSIDLIVWLIALFGSMYALYLLGTTVYGLRREIYIDALHGNMVTGVILLTVFAMFVIAVQIGAAACVALYKIVFGVFR